MTRDEILRKLTAVFRDVLDDPDLELADHTTAEDVEGWDSLAHVDLIAATERAFGVSFTTKDVMGLANVGGLVALIARRAG